MKLKTSFFNIGIFLDDLKRFGWIGVVYTLTLFFSLPLQIIMIYSREDKIYNDVVKNMFYFRNVEIQSFITLIIPVLAGIFLFRYMQVKASTDMIHSIPIKRSVLYRTHVLAGVLFLVVPVLINACISLIINAALDISPYYNQYNANDVFKWMGFTILMNLVIFLLCVLVGMVSGVSVVQGVLTYIIVILPLGLTALLTYNLNIFVYGFMYNIDKDIEKLSPVTRILEGYGDKMTAGEVIVYILLCIVLYMLSMYLYNKRKLEAVSQPIAFSSLNSIFKYGVTFCAMLLLGAYFEGTQKSVNWVFFGYIFGSLVGYFVAEMIIRKSIWVFKNVKGYIIFCAIMVIALTGMKLDVAGFESRIPSLDKVSSIYFSEGFYQLNNPKYKVDVYNDINNLSRIQEFHEQLIKDKQQNQYTKKNMSRNVVFVYQLKNGGRITRGYTIPYKSYDKYFKPIYESREYKNMHFDILGIDNSDVEKITINPNFGVNREAVIINPVDIKEAIGILKEEAGSETYEQFNSEQVSWASINVMIANNKIKKYPKLNDPNMNGGDKQYHFAWEKSYKKFEEWLGKKGYLENSRVLPKDISYAVVEKVNGKQEWNSRLRNGMLIGEKKGKRLEIYDKNQIEVCLREYVYASSEDDRKYIIGFYGKDGSNSEFGSFDENNVPDFIRKYFSK